MTRNNIRMFLVFCNTNTDQFAFFAKNTRFYNVLLLKPAKICNELLFIN